jgi:alpha-tubulin suppressor-like RCC1 family protein
MPLGIALGGLRKKTPVYVGNLPLVSGGGHFAAVIDKDGYLWTWGYNGDGRLGFGDTTTRYIPTKLGNDTWTSVACGLYHALAIKSDGTLWSWGSNSFGQLGLGDNTQRLVPTQVGTDTWIKISTGNSTSAGIKQNNSIWIWGQNTNGLIGDNTVINKNIPVNLTVAGTNGIDIKMGGDFVVASWLVDVGGGIFQAQSFTWGTRRNGALRDGIVTTQPNVIQKTPMSTNTGFSNVSTTGSSIYIFDSVTGTVAGGNVYGQLGLGDTTNRGSSVNCASIINARSISGKDLSTVLVKPDGSLWISGVRTLTYTYSSGNYGVTVTNSTSFTRIGISSDWVYASSGYATHYAVKSDGTLWAWGSNIVGYPTYPAPPVLIYSGAVGNNNAGGGAQVHTPVRIM